MKEEREQSDDITDRGDRSLTDRCASVGQQSFLQINSCQRPGAGRTDSEHI